MWPEQSPDGLRAPERLHGAGCAHPGLGTCGLPCTLQHGAGLRICPGLQTCRKHQLTGLVVRECLSMSLAAPDKQNLLLNHRLIVPDFLGRLHV